MKKEDLIKAIDNTTVRSAWGRGVKAYAIDILADVDLENVCNKQMLSKVILNGADNWLQYSEGGCAFCYDRDIAERLCTQTELKKFRHKSLYWIHVQARALQQAAELIYACAEKLYRA